MTDGWDSGTKETVRKIPFLSVGAIKLFIYPDITPREIRYQCERNAHQHSKVHVPVQTNAGPRDKELWEKRLKEELQALIKYIQINKGTDSDWFTITSNKDGTHWSGKCWYVHELIKYEFDFEFDIPATYPATAPEIKIPSLDGKTAKMYRGGAICLTVHFKPLWAKNSPRFGIGHAMCLGLAPWMAAEIPHMVDNGVISNEA